MLRRLARRLDVLRLDFHNPSLARRSGPPAHSTSPFLPECAVACLGAARVAVRAEGDTQCAWIGSEHAHLSENASRALADRRCGDVACGPGGFGVAPRVVSFGTRKPRAGAAHALRCSGVPVYRGAIGRAADCSPTQWTIGSEPSVFALDK